MRARGAMLCILSTLALGAVLPRTSHAQPSSATIAGAQVLVGEGRKLRAAGDLHGARERFESAYLLVPTPIIGLDLGKAREALGFLIEARVVLLESSALPPIANESAESKAARAEAIRVANELDGRIPTLAVSIEGAESGVKVVVTIDGVEVPEADLASPRKVNPGKHVVLARMGNRQERTQVELAEKEAKIASIVFAPVKALPEPVKPPIKPPPEQPRVYRTSLLTYVGFSVAGAGLVVGTITGIVAVKKAHTFTSACDKKDQCPLSTQSDYDQSRNFGNVSTVSFIVTGVGLAVGVYGLLSPELVPAPVAVSLGVGSVSVHGAF
ncbi:MAG: hypothetical protein ACXVEF_42800 [Polyangiales bacterium]